MLDDDVIAEIVTDLRFNKQDSEYCNSVTVPFLTTKNTSPKKERESETDYRVLHDGFQELAP